MIQVRVELAMNAKRQGGLTMTAETYEDPNACCYDPCKRWNKPAKVMARTAYGWRKMCNWCWVRFAENEFRVVL